MAHLRQTVVIVGAGWAGLSLAHQLLKQTLPRAPGLKVILVNPSTHFFWNIASPRAVIPGEISDRELYIPIAPVFARYPPESFELVLGVAEHMQPLFHSISIRLNAGDGKFPLDRTLRTIGYNHLIITTGSRVASDLPFKPVGTESHETHLEMWHNLQRRVSEAQSIVIGGGGPSGVEVAGELGARFGREKDIILVENSDHVLADQVLSVRMAAERDLKKLGVKLIHNNRATQVEGEDPRIIHLSQGGVLRADLFLPLYGVVPNSTFIPEDMLDWEGNLKLGPSLRVEGTYNIWGAGDVGNLEAKLLIGVEHQVTHLLAQLNSVLTGVGSSTEAYHPSNKTVIFFSFGRWHATGQVGNWKVFGFLVCLMKGRRLFIDRACNYVSGKSKQHAA